VDDFNARQISDCAAKIVAARKRGAMSAIYGAHLLKNGATQSSLICCGAAGCACGRQRRRTIHDWEFSFLAVPPKMWVKMCHGNLWGLDKQGLHHLALLAGRALNYFVIRPELGNYHRRRIERCP